MDADLLADREHIRAVNQPFIAVRCGDFHLIVDALENQVGDNALQRAFLRFYEVDVLRADDNVYRLVCSESLIDAGKFRTEDSTSSSWIIRPSTMLLSPMKSATNAFSGSL